MTVALRATTADLRRPVAAACLAAGPLAVVAAGDPLVGRGLLAAAGAVCLIAVAFRDRILVVSAMVGWLGIHAFLRRLLIPFAGWSEYDPLLLVGPATAVVLLVAARHDPKPARSALSAFVVFQLLWAAAQLLNPNEPSLVTAAQGALFFVTPMLWFFVGRTFAPHVHDRIHRLVLWVAGPVVVLGLVQTLFGLLPFEKTWLGVAEVPASLIFVGGFHIRPFSTLSSPQEYGMVLAFVVILLVVRLLHRADRRGWTAVGLTVASVTLFLQGSRGILLTTVVATGLVVAIHRRSVVGPLVLLVLLATFLVAGMLHVPPPAASVTASATEKSTVQSLVDHQIAGLTDPANSTLPLHARIAWDGIMQGVRNPIGLGPSMHRIQDFNDPDAGFSPETELAITMAALGIPAALALLGTYVTGFAAAIRLYRRRPTQRHLTWLALLIVAGDQAFNGRLYFASMLVALTYGGLARAWAAERSAARVGG